MAELVREILVDASPETIYPFLVEGDKHVLWEGTEANLDARPGGVYEVLIAGAYKAAGEFVELVPNEKVSYTFGWDDPDNPIKPGSTTVEITLHPEGGKTRVQLRHSGLPDEAVDLHIGGWDHYLARLAVAAPGGDAGPDAGPGGDG